MELPTKKEFHRKTKTHGLIKQSFQIFSPSNLCALCENLTSPCHDFSFFSYSFLLFLLVDWANFLAISGTLEQLSFLPFLTIIFFSHPFLGLGWGGSNNTKIISDQFSCRIGKFGTCFFAFDHFFHSLALIFLY